MTDNIETSEVLMISALSLIADKGYDNVTIDHIAKKIGNTKGVVYHYISRKKELSVYFLNKWLEEDL